MLTVTFSLEEAEAAAALWEAAVKALGDPAVDTYAHLRNKLREAVKAAEEAKKAAEDVAKESPVSPTDSD